MENTIVALMALIFTNNILMSGIKWLADQSVTSTWLRCVLIALSLLGIVAAAALNGTPVDFNQISELAKLLIGTVGLALASHLSYKAIKKA